jgi:hypothetical protein
MAHETLKQFVTAAMIWCAGFLVIFILMWLVMVVL